MFGLKYLLLLAWLAMPVQCVLSANIPTNTICCPVDWLGYDGHCYRHFARKVTWGDANYICAFYIGHGAKLVSIHTPFENKLIRLLSGGEQVWLGLNDMAFEGQFEWKDETHFDFNNWNDGQPGNHSDDYDCSEMTNGGKWNIVDCSTGYHGYVCKM